MKGIIKGSIFTILLMAIFISVCSVINMMTDIPTPVLKGILWIFLGLCTFLGSMFVSRSAESSRVLKGLASGILSILAVLLIISLVIGKVPSATGFYVFLLICFICSLLGSFVGAN